MARDARDAITVQDLTGRIVAWNPEAERMYGWSAAEALAMNIKDMTPPEQREDALAKTQQLSHAETLEPYLVQRVAKGGEIVEAWLTATAQCSEYGRGGLCYCDDRACGRLETISATGARGEPYCEKQG